MTVETVLSALTEQLPDYELIRDCLAGERRMKKRARFYIPVPDPDDSLLPSGDLSPSGKARYNSYVERAVFYNATARTLGGLVGLVFDKDPAIEILPSLEPVRADASGAGTPLDESAKESLREVMSIGREGLLTDYPRTKGPTTRAQAISGNVRPFIRRYLAEDIINWRTRTVGSRVLLSLVVLRETITVEDDGFTEDFTTQFRVLRLTGDEAATYQVELWKDGTRYDTFTPQDGAGKPFDEIPFQFVGAEDNTPRISKPPLLDIASLNKAHFRNSADYEESVFLVGQPTPVFAGLTKQWVNDVFTVERDDGHGNARREVKIRLGSRAAVPLPAGGSAELLQATPNALAFEAMEHKEKQMIALGAKLIENSGVMQTATEATLDNVLDNSVLANAARNVSKAYRQCLRWCERYISGNIVDDDAVIDYQLSTDFTARLMTAADRENIVAMWMNKAITWDEMRWNLKRTGTAYEKDDEAKAQIDEARQDDMAFETAAAAALKAAAGPQQQPGGGAQQQPPVSR